MRMRKLDPPLPSLPRRMRTAAYARVSTGKDAMLHSLSAQISYYRNLIGKNPNWEYTGVFVDEALTGTKDSRPAFQNMMREARAGNIDLILTKSISRFARNTVTVLTSVRELKSLGVDVFFEEQNIHALSTEGEVMLTILASYAQEESRSASENQKWRVHKNFREGKVCGMRMLGYRLADGALEVIPEEAELVRAIFDDYLSGMGVLALQKKLRTEGVKRSRYAIYGMLRNEKYQGDMILQKTFIADHVSKRAVKNTGQLPRYYVADSHEPIIPKEKFSAVQAEIARRAKAFHPEPKQERAYPFTGLIRCGKCGAPYKRKITGSEEKYKKPVWICGTFNTLGKSECDNRQVPEEILLAKAEEAGGFGGLESILVPEANRLVFRYADGREADLTWSNPSRSRSWTPEMREVARQRATEQHRRTRNG